MKHLLPHHCHFLLLICCLGISPIGKATTTPIISPIEETNTTVGFHLVHRHNLQTLASLADRGASNFHRGPLATKPSHQLSFRPSPVSPTTEVTVSTEVLLQQAQTAYQRGAYEQAITAWQSVLTNDSTLANPQRIDLSMNLATAYQAIGNYRLAYDTLTQAFALTKTSGSPTQQIMVRGQLGDVLQALQQTDAALKQINEGLDLARQQHNPLLIAQLLNHLGNLLSLQPDYPKAIAAYQEAAQLAEQQGELFLQTQILLNQGRTELKQGHHQPIVLQTALTQVHKLPNNLDKGLLLVNLGELALNQTQLFPQNTIYQLLTEALHLAEQAQEKDLVQDKNLLAYAKGYLGQLYEQSQRYPEALRLTREAIFQSQALPEQLYRWEGQRGRILQAQHDLGGAMAAYQQALTYLQPIRTELLSTGQRDTHELFYRQIQPLYFGLADVLLQQATAATSVVAKRRFLSDARDIIEQLKEAELQNYFQDCDIEMKTTNLDFLDKHTGVLYPVMLPDRLELLLTVADNFHQFTVPVTKTTLRQTALDFRKHLQLKTSYRFLTQAQQLYNWLITPLQKELKDHQINTLVMVPDGPLYLIPLAALHDGHHYLIEQLAVARVPGLALTDSRFLPRQQNRILLNGLTEKTQDFPPLPQVRRELNEIKTLFNHYNLLLDKSFSLGNLQQSFQGSAYSMVHIASHGEFSRHSKQSFLLTYDSKLTMDDLKGLLATNESHPQPVELLTLSACQTAVSDEQAALGLAGVAVKAGARSALATLWSVNDESTASLVTEFYHQLQTSTVSKAQALQNAQQQMLSQPKFTHPAYWAAFSLIGNWL